LGTFGWDNEDYGLEKRPFLQGHGLESRGLRLGLHLGRQGLGLGRQRVGLGLESQGFGLVSQGLGLGCQGLGLGHGDKGLDNITARHH